MAKMKSTVVDNRSRPPPAPRRHEQDSTPADAGVAITYEKKGKRKPVVTPAHSDSDMREPGGTSTTRDGVDKAKKKGARAAPPLKGREGRHPRSHHLKQPAKELLIAKTQRRKN